jgi:hypothetical protein
MLVCELSTYVFILFRNTEVLYRLAEHVGSALMAIMTI